MDNNSKCSVVNCGNKIHRHLITEGLYGVILSVPLCKTHYDEYTIEPDKQGSE